MADRNESAQELLLDVRVAEASKLYKFYLSQEKKILGAAGVTIFLIVWELVGNVLQLINPMFMSAPSLIAKAAIDLFSSGEIYNDLYISGTELLGGYLLSAVVAIPFGIMLRFARASVEAIHYFKNNKPQTIAILKKYAKTDVTTLDSAYAYLKNAIPDMPYPTLEGMKTILAEMGRTRPEVLKYDASTMVDTSIVKAIDDEGFLKKLK